MVRRQDVVHPCLVLDERADVASILQGPVHVPHDAHTREAFGPGPAQHVLHARGHPAAIEASASQVRLVPVEHFELPRGQCRVHGDTGAPHASEMLVTQDRVDDVNRLLPTVEPFLHEGKQGPILIVAAVEERADVRLGTETPARQRRGRLLAVHVIA